MPPAPPCRVRRSARCPPEHGRSGASALVRVLLDVGVAEVVVDHAAQVDVAPLCPFLGARLVADAGERMPGPLEAGNVDVHQGHSAATTRSSASSRGRSGAGGSGRGGAGPFRSSSAIAGRSRPGGRDRGRSRGGPAGPAPLRLPRAGAVGDAGASGREANCPLAMGIRRHHVEGGDCRPQRHPD